MAFPLSMRKRVLLLATIIISIVWPPSRAGEVAPKHIEETSGVHCIVGAGPAGLAVGRLLQVADVPYVIFEKEKNAGSFFDTYPVHRKLISINKVNTGSGNSEFNLRHDWNSLLTSFESNGTDFPFSRYSKEYFPDADALVSYFHDFASYHKLRIEFGTSVVRVGKADKISGTNLTLNVSDRVEHRHCAVVVWCPGVGKPKMLSKNSDILPYHKLPLDLSFYENKSVAIIGAGQSAFEIAKHMYGSTAETFMFHRSPPKFAWATHYVGNLRAVNNDFLDAFHLKSLDAVIGGLAESAADLRKGADGKYHSDIGGELLGNGKFDLVVSAIGWRFDSSAFAVPPKMMKGDLKKFPELRGSYESASHDGLYFAGAASHGLDKRKKSSGGFIHGFRYTARALVRVILLQRHRRRWTEVKLGCVQSGAGMEHKLMHQALRFSEAAMRRVGETSGLYQMFDVLVDVYVYNKVDQCLSLFEEVPESFFEEFLTLMGIDQKHSVFTMHFGYGEKFSEPTRNIFSEHQVVPIHAPPASVKTDFLLEVMPEGLKQCNFLHPVLRYRSKSVCQVSRPFHMMEDIRTRWNRPTDAIMWLDWFMTRVLSDPCRDLESHAAKDLGWFWKGLYGAFGRTSWSDLEQNSNGVAVDVSFNSLKMDWAAWAGVSFEDNVEIKEEL